MADYIKKIKTDSGEKQIDYEALGNLPEVATEIDETSTYEQLASAKAVYDCVDAVMGDVSAALDTILAIQETLVGGVD